MTSGQWAEGQASFQAWNRGGFDRNGRPDKLADVHGPPNRMESRVILGYLATV
jgi:hypothetical protein